MLTHAPTRPVPGKPVTVTIPALSPRSGKANLKVKAPTGYSVTLKGSKATITCTKAATCGPDGTDKNAYSLTFATWASGTVSVVFDDAQKPAPTPVPLPTLTANITGKYTIGDTITVTFRGFQPGENIYFDYGHTLHGLEYDTVKADANGTAVWTGTYVEWDASTQKYLEEEGLPTHGLASLFGTGQDSDLSAELTVPWVIPANSSTKKTGKTGSTGKSSNPSTGIKKPGKLPSTGN